MTILDISSLIFPLLFMTGFFAGLIDAIAGGGGLISLPVLFCLGVPPQIALGTNKLQSSIGTLIATWSYHRHGLISLRTVYRGIIFVLIGAISGASLAQNLNNQALKNIIPLLLCIIVMYAIFSPTFGNIDRQARMNTSWYYFIFGTLLGFYDGFLGPGTGSFWVFSMTFFLGYNLTKATAYTKVFNLTSNLAALTCFAIGNNIDYRIGLCMAAGQVIGGRIGAIIAIKKGASLIRPIFLVMVCITIGTLLYKQFYIHS